jgi:drug/metabolite transporter (DMT)-like permease
MNFERLTRGHVVAAVAALALLLVMAMDWYGSTTADRAREVAGQANPRGAAAGEVGREIQEDADTIIARDEKNAWQEEATIDRILLALLLATVGLPLAAAAFRARGRRFEPPWTPSAFAAMAAIASALLVAYRIVQEPGPNELTTVKLGAPLALLLLAAVGLGASAAFQKEADWAAIRRKISTPANERPEDA